MGIVHSCQRVRPIVGLLAAERRDLPGVRERLCAWLGPVVRASEPAPFTHTEYYTPEMGAGLWREYLAFSELRAPEDLAAWKLTANELERSWGLNPRGGRRVNVDPGYLAPGKLVLATTKDHAHRLYLRDGIYAEPTLRIQAGRFEPWPWTYPDYAANRAFFDAVYQEYLLALKAERIESREKKIQGG